MIQMTQKSSEITTLEEFDEFTLLLNWI